MSPATRAAELLARLKRGDDPQEILRSLTPEAEARTLARCATVRSFDQPLYDRLLRGPEPTAPTFQDIVEGGLTEPVVRTAGSYRMRGWARQDHWSWWWQGRPAVAPAPQPLVQFSAALADHYRKAADALEAAYHLLLADPERAMRDLRVLYEQAEGRFDLPACADIVAAINDPDRSPALSYEAQELGRNLADYMSATGHWLQEYFQTARYLVPEGAKDRYERLLGGASARAINLYAAGGMGKTAQIRWLISRFMAPPPRRVPCVRLDFDLLDVGAATRDPWLLLLEATAQLNVQLPRRPFDTLLSESGWALPLLLRDFPDRERVNAAARQLPATGERTAQMVTLTLTATLQSRPDPVVFVLDTLEEVRLRAEGDLTAMLEPLRSLYAACSNLRLVLSGRFDLREKDSGATAAFEPVEPVEVRGFDPDEARRYLRDIRGVTNDSIAEVVVRRSHGIALKLALYADLVEADPDITADALRSYVAADLAYLIERIVKRIQQPAVRWVLAYGVIPRQLNRTFLDEVMVPFLEKRRKQGPQGVKRNGDGRVSSADLVESGVLPALSDPIKVDRLWQDLEEYVANSSWVWRAAQEPAEGALRFHTDVVVPMRRLLRGEDDYRKLHEAAAHYFERLAEGDPDRWDHWMAEAVYHRFQLGGAKAAPYWRSAVRSSHTRWHPRFRLRLAEDLLGPDYQEEGVALEWDDTRPMVSAEALAAARLEQAVANVELAEGAELGFRDRLMAGPAAFVREQLPSRPRADGSGDLAFVRAAVAAWESRPQDALAEATSALGRVKGHRERARILQLIASVRRDQGDPNAPETYAQAIDELRKAGAPARLVLGLEAQLARVLFERARFDESIGVCDRVLHGISRAADERVGWVTLRNACRLRAGLWSHVIRESGGNEPAAPGQRLQAAEAHLARGAPSEAAQVARTVATVVQSQTGSEAVAARADELRGSALAALLELDEAGTTLDAARSRWSSLQDVEAVARCSVATALMHMRGAGNLLGAAQWLAEAESFALSAPMPAWVDLQLAKAELSVRTGDRDAALARLRDAATALRAASAPPHQRVAAGLALMGTSESAGMGLELVLEALDAITPASARLVALESVWRADTGGLVGSMAGLQLLSAFADDDASLNEPRLQITRAETLRLAGYEAADVLSHARRQIRRGGAFLLRDWWHAADRHGAMVGGPDALTADVDRFLTELGSYRTLCAAFLVERAEALIRVGDPYLAAALAARARALITKNERRSQWPARLLVLESRLGIGDPANTIEQAAGIFRDLGDSASASQLSVTGIGAVPALSSPGVVTLDLDGDGVHVDVDVPPHREASIHPPTAPEARLVAQTLLDHGEGAEVFSLELLTLLGRDWRMLGGRLGDLLGGPDLLRSLTGNVGAPGALRLDPHHRLLHPVPWELAMDAGTRMLLGTEVAILHRGSSSETAQLEESLELQGVIRRLTGLDLPTDGVLEAVTMAALSTLLNGMGLGAGIRDADLWSALREAEYAGRQRAPAVVLVHPESSGDQVRGRGVTGITLNRLYQAEGCTVHVLEQPTFGSLSTLIADLAKSGPVDILHLSGEILERGTRTILSFSGGDWGRNSSLKFEYDELGPTSLAALLDAFPRTARPLVILDIAPSPEPLEAAKSVLLRNSFAGDLFSLGAAWAVITAGLAHSLDFELYRSMIAGLCGGRSVGEVCNQLRRMGLGTDAEMLSAATALFTHLPYRGVVRAGSNVA